MIYFAYGSNLHIEQMARRCPAADPLGWFKLDNWRLVFRGVADVIREQGAVCYGGIWRITADCEAALDRYEGVGAGMYRKEYIQIKKTPQGEKEMLVYVMNSTGIAPPAAYYLGVIKQGYNDFHLPKKAWPLLQEAVRDSWDDKAPTHVERQRRKRNGRPPLAAYPKQPAMPATGA